MGENDVRAMPSARSGELRSEPVPVSAVPAPATIAALYEAAELGLGLIERIQDAEGHSPWSSKMALTIRAALSLARGAA